MKKRFFGAISVVFCVFSCNTPTVFSPQPSSNLWQDDYRAVSKLENYKKWGTYNVHDPACKKFRDHYYMYSTDAIFGENAENRKKAKESGVPLGYIQVRRSTDMINWEFLGWAFQEIPHEATAWVRAHADGRGATNIWAPYIIQHNDIYRLYYCVSAFGKKASYLGLAESASPEGPWELKGCVVKTNNESAMNAIDPSVVVDAGNGKWWMHYGSFFGGLFCLELNPETGLPVKEGDQGHLVARRANYRKDNLEAPEIIYNPELKKYYLFNSYDPLMTTYNIRVGRSDSPEGPFFDFDGRNLKDTTNSFPVLTAPYRFDNHPGWAGTGHNAALSTGDGRYFVFHQARLSPQNELMVLHAREMFFNSDGWPVVSPQRYAGSASRQFTEKELVGEWEVIRILEPRGERNLEAGQILWGENRLTGEEWNSSFHIRLNDDGKIEESGNWYFLTQKQTLKLTINEEEVNELLIFAGHDWENQTETILFAGLDRNGRSVWGKRVK